MERVKSSMTEGPILKAMVFYTVPVILTSILQLLFNAADLIVVGRFCGSTSVAAVGATGSLTSLIVNLFIGLSVGAGVSVAHAYGANDDRTLHRTIHTSIAIAIVAGSVLTVVGVTFSETFLRLMDTPENILPLSAKYMKIYFCGIIFNMIYNYSASILRAVGDTKRPLIFLTIAGIINVILNVLFVTVFHMNVAGVALATTISQAVSTILVVLSLMHRTDTCRLFLKEIKLYKEQFLKVIKIGLPAGIQSSLFAISNVIVQSSVNSFGDHVISGNSAAANIEGFVYVILNAFMQTAVNFVGQNYGAGQYKRIKKSFLSCIIGVFVVGCAVGFLTYYFAPNLLSIYITDSDEAIAAGITRMTYVCLPYFLCGIMDVTTGAIRGLGSSFTTMIISIAGIVGVRITWLYTVFPMYNTLESLFISYIVSWSFTAICQFIAFFIVYKKKINIKEKNSAIIKDA